MLEAVSSYRVVVKRQQGTFRTHDGLTSYTLMFLMVNRNSRIISGPQNRTEQPNAQRGYSMGVLHLRNQY